MNKAFGAQSELKDFPFKDVSEVVYNKNGMEIEVKEGILYVGVDDESKLEEAKKIAGLYVAAWSKRQNIKIDLDFNHIWVTNPQGIEEHAIGISDSAKAIDRVQVQVTHQATLQGKARIINQAMHDSASFTNDAAFVEKALKNPTLAKAMEYYDEEIVDDDKPLYGIYKAIEVIAEALGGNKEGRKQLANLAGQTTGYVADVMSTADTQRHANPKGVRKLTDEECRERAKALIDAYSNSL